MSSMSAPGKNASTQAMSGRAITTSLDLCRLSTATQMLASTAQKRTYTPPGPTRKIHSTFIPSSRLPTESRASYHFFHAGVCQIICGTFRSGPCREAPLENCLFACATRAFGSLAALTPSHFSTGPAHASSDAGCPTNSLPDEPYCDTRRVKRRRASGAPPAADSQQSIASETSRASLRQRSSSDSPASPLMKMTLAPSVPAIAVPRSFRKSPSSEGAHTTNTDRAKSPGVLSPGRRTVIVAAVAISRKLSLRRPSRVFFLFRTKKTQTCQRANSCRFGTLPPSHGAGMSYTANRTLSRRASFTYCVSFVILKYICL